jgi:enoyl-CoA hydratase/carnithine racemase
MHREGQVERRIIVRTREPNSREDPVNPIAVILIWADLTLPAQTNKCVLAIPSSNCFAPRGRGLIGISEDGPQEQSSTARESNYGEASMSEKYGTGRIQLVRHTEAYWRVTIDIPPLNIFGPAHIPQLEEIVSSLETDERVKVVVFDSAIDGFFMTHYDLLAKPEDSAKYPPGPTGLQAVPDMFARLSRAPVASIALIRGRATGIGSELVLACDMRFASREKTVLSQWEVGAGFVPGGGPMARLPRLIGRGRALEVLLGSDDIGGDLAELYGYVNRALPDAELADFVDSFARRIASFDKQAIAKTKRLVNLASLPPDAEISPEWGAFIESVGEPAAQERIKKLLDRGLHRPGDVENRLGHHLGELAS